ncbi:MAG: cyclic lactone autoinducer peptide [Erysipelotrichaceae bacterium]
MIKKRFLSIVKQVAISTAKSSANTTCLGPSFQPKEPSSLNKFKK